MIPNKQWVDLLDRQHSLVINSAGGRDLLLAVRKFVDFLDTDLPAKKYINELNNQWAITNRKRRDNFNEIHLELLELEKKIRKGSAELEKAIKNLSQLPDTPHYGIVNDLAIFKESDLSQKATNLRDDLEPELVQDTISQTQTGFICSHLWSFAQRLDLLAQSIGIDQNTALELYTEADGLMSRYIVERHRLNYDWMSSGQYALEQLRIVVAIFNGDLFVHPFNFKFQKIRSFSQWKTLMLEFAPKPFLEKIRSSLFNIETENIDLKRDVEPLIKKYASQIFEELRFLAYGEFAHQDNLKTHNEVQISLTTNIPAQLSEIKQTLDAGFKDIKRGQAVLYRHVSKDYNEPLKQIIEAVKTNRIEQIEMAHTLKTIRRALRVMQMTESRLGSEIRELVKFANNTAVENKLRLEQRLEYTLPIIPIFLDYKVELATGSEVDLNAVINEVKERWQSLLTLVKK